VEDALQDPNWVVAIQEELNNFKRNKVLPFFKGQSKMLWEPIGYFSSNTMNMELLQGLKKNLWPRDIHKSKIWIFKKHLLP
jgi:hypothetical protein